MSASPSTLPTAQVDKCHDRFLAMASTIRRMASYCFRREPRADREDLIAEVLANSYVAFARLVERGKVDFAFPTVLARYAIRQIRAGRRVGNRPDIHDLLSTRVQRGNGFFVHGLWEQDAKGKWEELAVEDRRATPAQVAIVRLDFKAWLKLLTLRDRRIAVALAIGTSTSQVAKRFRISPARVSQLRRHFFEHWHQFQGEAIPNAA